MSISYRSVYLTPSTSDFRTCRLGDVSLYATDLYALFEATSYARPSQIALEVAGEEVTYEALSGRINLCAAGLQALGAEQSDVIVFSMEKSISLIIAVLAALKIGAKICVLPSNLSALRLRAIQQSMSVAFHINSSGVSLDIQHDATDYYTSSVRTVSYEQVAAAGVHSGSATINRHAVMTAAQLLVSYNAEKGLHCIDFSQDDFLKVISKLDDILPSSEPDQKILITTAITKPCFLLEMFYAFSRQLTCVLGDNSVGRAPHFAGYALTLPVMNAARLFLDDFVSNMHLKEIEIQGLRVSLDEIEYFASQYPGVRQAKAFFSVEGLELRVQFSWDFYPTPVSRRITAEELKAPQNEADRLACRLFNFLSQHLWSELPIKAVILLPE